MQIQSSVLLLQFNNVHDEGAIWGRLYNVTLSYGEMQTLIPPNEISNKARIPITRKSLITIDINKGSMLILNLQVMDAILFQLTSKQHSRLVKAIVLGLDALESRGTSKRPGFNGNYERKIHNVRKQIE
jgi:hypothetical protein